MEDLSYLEFVERRLSLVTTPLRDICVSLTGAEPFILVPVTQVLLYKTQDTGIQEVHKEAQSIIDIIRSLQPPGFHGSTYDAMLEDITLGIYIAG
jgi:hypothetical protein